MAEKIAVVVEDYLTCPVCLEIFKEPVSLGCHHSFCFKCLQNYWDKNNTKKCLICRKWSKDHLFVNFALKELTLSFTEKQKSEAQPGGNQVCSKHADVPSLFCKDEGLRVCPVCEFSLHRDHTVVPVETAVTELKEQLQSDLKALREKRGRVKAVETRCEEMLRHSRKQAEFCESQIRATFERLRQFLKEEEESHLAVLRVEQKRQAQTIGPELESIREQLSCLSQSIQALEEHLQKDTGVFLDIYSFTQSQAQTQGSQPDPQLGSGLLIDTARVLGNLGFRVWEKMKSTVHYSPVVLDPNSAHRWLHLSEDLTSVRSGERPLQLPDNPERFSEYATVLGSEGFSSGFHSWDVEVGDHPHWVLGVVQESVDRKGKCRSSREYGVWCLAFYNGKYSCGNRRLKLEKSLQEIQIQLDYDSGTVLFFDSDDMSLINTHQTTFTEKVFPYFCLGPAAEAETKALRVCPYKTGDILYLQGGDRISHRT